MTDYVADLKNFRLADRAVAAFRLRVAGSISDYVQIGLKDVEVDRHGIAVVNMGPDQAMQIANELTKLALEAKRRIS
jgi:hypothetical protein